MNAVTIVAIMVPAIVTVGALVAFIQRAVGRELATVVSETNAALRSLADQGGLDLVEPQAGSRVRPGHDAFAEARGICFGVPIRASVESVATDDLSTALRLQGRAPSAASLETLGPLVDRVAVDEHGLTLYLGRKTRFGKPFLLTYDRLPETDLPRLVTALERGCAVLQPAAAP